MAVSLIKFRTVYGATTNEFVIPAVANAQLVKTEPSVVWQMAGASGRDANLYKFQGQRKTYELVFPLYYDNVDRASGTHTVVVKTPKEQENYLTNFMFRFGISGDVDFYYYDDSRHSSTGTHDGANGQASMTDSTASFVADQLIGTIIFNDTDVSSAKVTDNTATNVTGTLDGGTQDDWDTGETYTIWEGIIIDDLSIREEGGNPNVRNCTIRFTVGSSIKYI